MSVPYTFGTNTYAQSGQIDANFASVVNGSVQKTGDTMTGALTVNQVATPVSPATGASLYVLGPNATTVSMVVDAYGGPGATPEITSRRGRGTAAAPTAVQSGDPLLTVQGIGYAATTWGTAIPQLLITANENWTATANGSAVYFQTAPNGGTAMVNSLALAGNTATFSGTVTAGSDISATGVVHANGPASSLLFQDRSTTTPVWQWYATGSIARLNNGVSGDAHTFDTAGNLTITGPTATKASGTTWANPSAREIKQDIKSYDKGLQAILGLRPSTYRFSEDSGLGTDETHIGLVHDETGHMPEMHKKARIGVGPDSEGREVDALDCSAITFALIRAVQELAAKVEALEKR